MQLPITITTSGRTGLQRQIYEQIRSLILSGVLRPGQQLPSSRALAQQLGVSRNTVLITYDRLTSEGYLQSHPAKDTFVSLNIPEDSIMQGAMDQAAFDRAPKSPTRRPLVFSGQPQRLAPSDRPQVGIDFFVGRPDPHSFPLQTWRRLVTRKLVRPGPALTEYGDPAGLRSLREAIAVHLGAARGIRTEPEQIVVCNGIQEALNIVARLFVKRGTPIAAENPCYHGVANVFGSYGCTLVPVPVDAEGIDLGQLPRRKVSLICVTPSHQFPTGYTLSLNRRLRLLDWAANQGSYIVEDDYDSDFRYDGPPLMALAGLDQRGLVIYLGTFSKSIGAGLRIGYLVVPSELVPAAVAVKSILDNGHPWLDQAVLAEFISSGEFARHLRRIRVTYKNRRDCLIGHLESRFGAVNISGQRGGMHVMWQLPSHFPDAGRVEVAARNHGVAVYSIRSGAGYDFEGSPFTRHALLFGYPAVSEDEIRVGVDRLAKAIEEVGAS